MTPRLTAPQMAVLRALGEVPEGKWVTPAEGGFPAEAATQLWGLENSPLRGLPAEAGEIAYRLSWRGRDLVERLSAASGGLNQENRE